MSSMQRGLNTHIKCKIIRQGQKDDFFAGEEFKDFEKMNPNKDMGFSKFELRPHPDFVVQCLGDHYEE